MASASPMRGMFQLLMLFLIGEGILGLLALLSAEGIEDQIASTIFNIPSTPENWGATLALLSAFAAFVMSAVTGKDSVVGVMALVIITIPQELSLKVLLLVLFIMLNAHAFSRAERFLRAAVQFTKARGISRRMRKNRYKAKLRVSRRAHKDACVQLDRAVVLGKILDIQSSGWIASNARTISILNQEIKALQTSTATVKADFSHTLWFFERQTDRLMGENDQLKRKVARLEGDVANDYGKIQVTQDINEQLNADHIRTIRDYEKRLERNQAEMTSLKQENLRLCQDSDDKDARIRELETRLARQCKVQAEVGDATRSEDIEDPLTCPPTPSSLQSWSGSASSDFTDSEVTRGDTFSTDVSFTSSTSVAAATNKAGAEVLIAEAGLCSWWSTNRGVYDTTIVPDSDFNATASVDADAEEVGESSLFLAKMDVESAGGSEDGQGNENDNKLVAAAMRECEAADHFQGVGTVMNTVTCFSPEDDDDSGEDGLGFEDEGDFIDGEDAIRAMLDRDDAKARE